MIKSSTILILIAAYFVSYIICYYALRAMRKDILKKIWDKNNGHPRHHNDEPFEWQWKNVDTNIGLSFLIYAAVFVCLIHWTFIKIPSKPAKPHKWL